MSDFEQLYIRHFTGVFRFLLSLCRDAALAEELTQETFYRAMKGLGKYRGDCSAHSWLCQIAKNAYFSHTRKAKMEPLESIPPAKGGDALTRLLEAENTATLHRLLHRLDEPYKEVFTLRVFAQLPYPSIAALFERNENWARVAYYRVRVKLADMLKEEAAHEQ